MANISQIPRGYHRQKTKLQETSRLHKINRKINLLKVLNLLADVNAGIITIYTETIHSTLEYGAVTFVMMVPSNMDRLQVSQNQGMRLILGVPRGTSAKMMKHELQMLPVEHRAKLSRAKLYRKIRGNTKHPLLTTINNEMNGPLRYRNVTDSYQDNWRKQHNYKDTTQLNGNNYHTNVG